MTDDLHDSENARPIDLSPLDPLRDAVRFDATARAIVRDAMAARAARRGESVVGSLALLANWSTPILAAAAVIIAASVPLLVRSSRELTSPVEPQAPGVAAGPMTRYGVPTAILALAQSRAEPTAAELVAAFDARWSGSESAP